MSSQHIGIEDARKKLGDLVTAAIQGTDTVLTRNGRPVARVTVYQEDPVITIAEMTATLGLPASAQERVARFAGAYTVVSDYTRTGRIPPRWAGKGLAASFTRDEADTLVAEWNRASLATDGFTDLRDGTEAIEQLPNQWRA